MHAPIRKYEQGSSTGIRTYRPFIDSLRAVAILTVVGSHLDLPGFTGGYIGVDIFFVISGYLIIGQIVEDIKKERFHLFDFFCTPRFSDSACFPLCHGLLRPPGHGCLRSAGDEGVRLGIPVHRRHDGQSLLACSSGLFRHGGFHSRPPLSTPWRSRGSPIRRSGRAGGS
jgi:acyltransferase-like protein